MQLPKALPDESLFSRICRYLAIYELSLEQTLQRLVGNGRSSIHPYLTSNLHIISQFSNESPEHLLSQQTLRPLFSYYLPQYRTIIDDITAKPSDILRASQLSTFRCKERLSVKSCPLCAQDDIYDFGVAYWHLAHQVPGVEACLKHKTWLLHNNFLSRSHANRQLLPDVKCEPCYCSNLAREFSLFVFNKVNYLRSHTESHQLGYYLNELKANNCLTIGGSIKRKKLAADLFELSEELFSNQSELSIQSVKDFRYVSSLLSGQYPQHPFKYLLLEFYLFRFQTSDKSGVRLLSLQQTHKNAENTEKQCCDLLKSGKSMASVSRQIDKSRCYVKSIALKNNIPVNLKPKKITKNLKISVIKLAEKGFHREAIAKLHGISSGSVEFIISTTQGLVEWRKRCKAESLGRKYRCQITRFINTNPNAYRQEIKNHLEAAFFWLYIHEHDWLENVLPVATKVQHVDRVDWHQRDSELVDVIHDLLHSSSTELSRTELDQSLGGHGWLTSKISKLPKTKQLLREKGLFPPS